MASVSPHDLSLHAHTAVDQLRRSPPSNASSSSPCRQSPLRDSSSVAPIRKCVKRSTMDPPPLHHNRRDLASDRRGIFSKLETKSMAKDVEEPPIKKTKIVIKIPSSRKREEEIPIQTPEVEKKLERIKEESKVVRNLRPRDSIRRPKAADAEVPDRSNGSKSRENCQKTKKKTKDRLSICIPLSKEEIEEDIFSMTGLKPKKKPKKRPRTLQNQLDNLFPGLRLLSISAQSYK